MGALSKFPRNFNSWTPKGKEPFSTFFVRVNEYFDDPQRLDFSKKENVKLFNDGLTKAIRRDINNAKYNFLKFREKLELAEKAFDSLEKAYYFLDDFQKFAEDCLSKSFQWTEFEDYVKDLTKKIAYFQKIKTMNYSTGDTPVRVEWPYMEEEDISVDIADIARKTQIVIKIGPYTRPSKEIADKTEDNFEKAIAIYDKLIDDCLKPEYEQLMVWVSKTMCWQQIKNEFQDAHEKLIEEVEKEKKIVLPEKEKFEALLRTHKPDDKALDLLKWARKSVDEAGEALHKYYSMEEDHQRIMLDTVTKAYRHALDLLESCVPLVTTEKWTQTTEFAENERRQASVAVLGWRDRLENVEIDKISEAKELTTVLSELPEIYSCIAQFTFEYHSPY